jgi:hypothetical protein
MPRCIHLEERELALLREMLRRVYQLDAQTAIVGADGPMMPGAGLTQRVHPAIMEARSGALTTRIQPSHAGTAQAEDYPSIKQKRSSRPQGGQG